MEGAAASAFLLAFYGSLYPLRGFRVPLGSDTPAYIWWASYAGAEGMGPFRTGTRPGIVAILATLSRVWPGPLTDVAAAIGPVMAVTVALGAAAWVDVSLGRDRIRFWMTVVLAGTFLSLMVAGYFPTLAFGTMFLAAMTCLAANMERRAWLPLLGAGALVGAAAAAHFLFLTLGAAIMGGAALALLPSWRRDLRLGRPWHTTGVAQLAIAGLAGAGLAHGALALSAGTPGRALDSSRDALLRRKPIPEQLEESYRAKFLHDFPWYRVLTLLSLAATPLVARGVWPTAPGAADGSPDGPLDRRRLLWGGVGGWLALTAAGLALLLLGLEVPGQRLAAFCLPLPILAAIGLSNLHAGSRRGARAMRRALVWAAAGVFVAIAWLAWANERPLISEDGLAQVRQAGAALALHPKGTPLILITDRRGERPSLEVTRRANYLLDAVPPARVADVYVFVGTPADFLARRVTLTGDREHDVMARDYWAQTKGALGRAPVAVVMEAFDPEAYREVSLMAEVARRPESFRAGAGVWMLPGFTGSHPPVMPGDNVPAALREPGAEPFSPWIPLALAPLILVLLGAVGWPWARAALPNVDGLIHSSLAPAFGLAAMSLASIAVDAAGIRLSGAGAWLALSLAVGGGITFLWMTSTAAPGSNRGRERGQ